MLRVIALPPSAEKVIEVPVGEVPALLRQAGARLWVDVSGPAEEADKALLRDVFRFHPLAIEDCFESHVHPKIDEYDDYLYLITHGLTASASVQEAQVVELDAFVSANFLVTHHAQPSRSIEAAREQVMRTGYPLRQGTVALLHGILDRQADGLEAELDSIEERIGRLEDAVFAEARTFPIASLLTVKRTIVDLRRWMAKQRDVLLRLGRREFPLITAEEALMFRDVHDHLVRMNDMLESFRDMLTSIQDAHMSAVANRTNDIMKFLTLFSTTLLPLTVITGIYGMNFDHMPELRHRFGYPFVLGAMAVVSGSMLLYFRKRGWLGKPPRIGADDDPAADEKSKRG
jgi:magnesium transporter